MPKYTVTVARDLSEYADLIIDAPDADSAEEQVRDMIDATTLPPLTWRAGDDREGLDVIDSQEIPDGK